MKILIVEDNNDLQDIYKGLFEAAGHQAYVSSDGLDGVTKTAEVKPDVVLLDILMPEMDGYEYLAALRDNTSVSPLVIVCSNLADSNDIDRALTKGAHYYLRKSDFVGDQLVKEVERLYRTHAIEKDKA